MNVSITPKEKAKRQRKPRERREGIVRLCNVSYLNSIPFRRVQSLDFVEYEECFPSECARRLHEDEADLACIPVVDAIEHGGYYFLPYGIVAHDGVESVTLFSRKPLSELEHIYVDDSSLTSVILMQLLLNSLPDSRQREISRMPSAEILERIGGTTGGLLIGDPALRAEGAFPYAVDLASWWKELTGLPFAFAVWAYRKSTISETELSLIADSFSEGIENREVYARAWADEHDFDRARSTRYLLQSISYEISREVQHALIEFIRRAHQLGLLPDVRLNFFPRNAPDGRRVGTAGSRPPSVDSLLSDSSTGGRLSIVDGLRIATEASLMDLSLASDIRRRQLHSSDSVSYIVDRNINYTNVCNIYCRFCAFYEAPGKGGYVLSKEAIGTKIQEMVDAGGIQILLQGGLNPELGIEYYEDLFRWIKENYPVNLHALSADEIIHISQVSAISVEEVFRRLIEAGLGSFPGGGGEILVDRVRRRIARLKSPSKEWLDVHRVAHRLGLTSTCTMMFGVNETWEDRILHLDKLRRLQDETGKFTAFISWPFQEDNTKLDKGDTSSTEYLRVQAVSRLFLDNIANLQSSWVTQGPSVGQIALLFGANDFGSVMFEENVVSSAGTTFQMDGDLIERHISEAGFQPWRRDVHYNQLEAANN